MTTSLGPASQVWQWMRTIVLTNERRQQACETLGLSATRLKALLQVSAGAISQRDLVTALNSEPAYITLVVDELERRGFVERRADPADRRRKLVSLTSAGAKAAQRATAILTTPPPTIASLPDKDLAALLDVLGPLAERTNQPDCSRDQRP